jgi:hypothetical protein
VRIWGWEGWGKPLDLIIISLRTNPIVLKTLLIVIAGTKKTGIAFDTGQMVKHVKIPKGLI